MEPCFPNRRPSRMHPALSQRLYCLICVLMCWTANCPAYAQTSGNTINYLTRSYQGKSPLSILANIDFSESMLIATLNTTITCNAGPSPSDRRLELVLYIKNWTESDGAVAYRFPIVLPQGKNSIQFSTPFCLTNQASWAIDIFEDGREIVDRRSSVRSGSADFQYISYTQSGYDVFLASLIDSKTDASIANNVLARFPGNANLNRNRINNMAIAGTPSTNTSRVVSVDNASEDWRSYFAYSGWVVSPLAVDEILRTRPKVATAIRSYVAAGGTIIASDFSQSESSIESFNRFLYGTQESPNAAKWTSLGTGPRRWWSTNSVQENVNEKEQATKSAPNRSLNLNGAAFDAIILGETVLTAKYNGYWDDANAVLRVFGFRSYSAPPFSESRDKLLGDLVTDKLLVTRFAGGQVVVATRPLNELSVDEITTITQRLKGRGWEAVAPGSDGSWYFQNMIMEVGKPPVWAFCAMVGIFGSVLGPGLLLFTSHRRSLMIFLVPIFSLIATSLVIAYGVLHEGFDSHVRVTSVTHFDGRSKSGFAWSRQNFFSALPPREGMKFASDTFIRKVYDHEFGGRVVGGIDPRRSNRYNVYIAEQQRWVGSLRPRQHQQYLIGHPVSADHIPIQVMVDADDQLQVTNLTDQLLPFVVLRGRETDYYLVTDLAPGQSQTCKEDTFDIIANQVSKLSSEIRPRVPEELQSRNSLMTFGSTRNYWAVQGTVGGVDVLSNAMADYLTDKIKLDPYGFITIVPDFKGISVPIEGKRAGNSLNVVTGVLAW